MKYEKVLMSPLNSKVDIAENQMFDEMVHLKMLSWNSKSMNMIKDIG